MPEWQVFGQKTYAWRPIHSESISSFDSNSVSRSFELPQKQSSKISSVGVGYGDVPSFFISKCNRTNVYCHTFRGADYEYNNQNSQKCHFFDWQSKQEPLTNPTFFDFAPPVEEEKVLSGLPDFSNMLPDLVYPIPKETSRSKVTL